MENMNDGILDTYLFECNSLLERLDELLLNAEEVGDFSSEDVNEIFRSMHTIKGSSAMMDFQPLMEVSHHIEDLFFDIRENGIESLGTGQKSDLFNLLFKSTDRLREDMEKVAQGEELAMDVESIVKEIDDFLAAMKGEANTPDIAPVADIVAPTATSTSTEEPKSTPAVLPIVPVVTEVDAHGLPKLDCPYFLHVLFDEDCGMESLRAFMVVTAIQEEEVAFLHYPPDVETNSDTATYIIDNGFYIGFNSEEDVETGVAAVTSMSNIRSYEIIFNPDYIEMTENMQSSSESRATPISTSTPPEVEVATSNTSTSESEVTAQEVKPATKEDTQKQTAQKNLKSLAQNKQSLISVNLSKLDKLMALVGEIVITESMVAASPELQNVPLDSFLKSSRQLRKLTDELQDVAMSLRMIPISGVFQKMNRIVRDMVKALDKDVKLTIIGEHTEIDKTIVESIGDPIMHIVRNAMDHGIENNVEDRIAAGKNPQGHITLSAYHASSEVIISIENDGEPLDPEKILAKAEKKGLLTKAPEDYTRKEVFSLLMYPGFSTNSEITEYSGRGVGLDVVKKNIEAIGGSVTINSDVGQGVCFTLKIPLTLAIVDGMEIAVGTHIFTIPIAHIKQSFKAKKEDIILDPSGNEIIRCMDEFYPIFRLKNLFQLDDGHTDIEDGVIVWVEANDKSFCLFVDALNGEQHVVVKPLPPYLNNFNIKKHGISGCTIMGDGTISIILDVGNIYTTAQEIY